MQACCQGVSTTLSALLLVLYRLTTATATLQPNSLPGESHTPLVAPTRRPGRAWTELCAGQPPGWHQRSQRPACYPWSMLHRPQAGRWVAAAAAAAPCTPFCVPVPQLCASRPCLCGFSYVSVPMFVLLAFWCWCCLYVCQYRKTAPCMHVIYTLCRANRFPSNTSLHS
jgi:hypothetical protein